MAMTVVLVLTGSMLMSLTVIPALVGIFLRRQKAERESGLIHRMKQLYRPVVAMALRRAKVVVTVAAVLVVAGLVCSPGWVPNLYRA